MSFCQCLCRSSGGSRILFSGGFSLRPAAYVGGIRRRAYILDMIHIRKTPQRELVIGTKECNSKKNPVNASSDVILVLGAWAVVFSKTILSMLPVFSESYCLITRDTEMHSRPSSLPFLIRPGHGLSLIFFRIILCVSINQVICRYFV
jgi:hypothetical protein